VSSTYEDDLRAATDLVDRTGARGLELGYVDGAIPGRVHWYAHAQYAGARVIVEDKRGPLEALEALAHRLLTDARCPYCDGLVALPTASDLLDGNTTEEQLPTPPRCHYRREGQRWVRGCEPVHRPRKPKRHRRKPHRR
jgi:hypothetical protein